MLTKIKTAIVVALIVGSASAALAAPTLRPFDRAATGCTVDLGQGQSIPCSAGP